MLDVEIEKKENKLNNLEINKKNNLINLEKIEKNNLINNKINKNNTKIKFIKLDNRIFEEKNINISELNSQEEIIEKINSEEFSSNIFYKIILTGSRNIEINENEICKLVEDKNILKVENKTETKYDFDKLSKQNNLKGIFVKMMLEKLNDKNYSKEEIKRAIEIGLKAFE